MAVPVPENPGRRPASGEPSTVSTTPPTQKEISIFAGLSAFPLTPLLHDAVDERSFIALVERLAESGVDSITVLGSTGSYAYLSAEERARVARLAVAHAGPTPVFVGVGALRTSAVLENILSAEDAGAGPAIAGTLVAGYGVGNLIGSALLMVWPLRGDADRLTVLLAGIVATALVVVIPMPSLGTALAAFVAAGVANAFFFAATLAARSE